MFQKPHCASLQNVMRNVDKRISDMNRLIFILLFGLIVGCTPIYFLNNKKQILYNDNEIKTLTDLINKNDYKTFLSRLKISNDIAYYSKDTLGFNYFRQMNDRCLNDDICFSTSVILYNDSIISISVNPSFSWIRPIIQNHYKKTFKKFGWTHEHENYFKSKYFNYSASTIPLTVNDVNFKLKVNSHFDSLMSPFYPNNKSDYLSNLTTDELFYLMHSISPHVRTGVIKHIKCNKIQTNSTIDKWTEIVIKNSPFMLAWLGGCNYAYEPIDYFIKCDEK